VMMAGHTVVFKMNGKRGVPTDGDLNMCQIGNCWCTDRNADYNDNAK